MSTSTRTDRPVPGSRTPLPPPDGARPAGAHSNDREHPAAALAAALAVMAVLTSAAPLAKLFSDDPWRPGALLQVAVVALVGVTLRLWGRGPGVVACAQLLAVVTAQSVLFPGPRPVAGGLIPTTATLETWRSLGAEAVASIASNPAPAPANDGVAFVVVAFVAVVAWAVDVVAVSSGMPGVAALPLLTPLLTAVANAPQPLNALELPLPLILWGGMLAERERGWPAGLRAASTSARLRLASVAGVIALAVATAVGAAGVLPHLPAHYLAEGISSGDFGRPDRVGFSPDADMLADLRDGDPTPVLVYGSDDPALPPLRVSVATSYVDGIWEADEIEAQPSSAPQLPYPAGLRSGVPRTEATLRVERTELAAPYLASPTPIVSGTVVGARWAVEEGTGAPVVDRSPRSYDLRYLSLAPTAAQLHVIERPRRASFADELRVPSAANTDLLAARTAEAVGGARTPYEKAVGIQAWLREHGGFSYSLELEPPPPGMSDQQAADTALDRFLTSKRGYCVQFTTAMVMMARREGIPARVATGFLPGVPRGDVREVRASDAHAWPELYFAGVGWLRFEPTPAGRSGAAPEYTGATDVQTPPPASTPTATPTPELPTATDQPVPPAETDAAPEESGGTVGAGGTGPTWGGALVAALLLALVLGAVPLAARWSLAARRRGAHTPAERAEVEWSALRDVLKDLGLHVPEAATPRVLVQRISESAVLDSRGREALARVLAAVEQARYAPPSAGPATGDGVSFAEELMADARTVARVASSLRSLPLRARAALLPRAGLRALRLPIPDALQPRPAPERSRHVRHTGSRNAPGR